MLFNDKSITKDYFIIPDQPWGTGWSAGETLYLTFSSGGSMEEEYLTVREFCNKHRYPITNKLLVAAERDILIKCRVERIRIKVAHHIAAGKGPTRSFPRWILEEYFMLYVK